MFALEILSIPVNAMLMRVWEYAQDNPLELVAALFGVISVWYSRKNNILVYPTGIISVLIYVFICYEYRLYADAGLNVYYFIMSVIGWVNWSRKKADTLVFPISQCNSREWLYGSLVFFITLFTLVLVLYHFTDSNTVIADAMVSSSAASAMWWMARRKLESWMAWTISNVVAIPLFFYKELYFTVAQYLIFLILAVWGYFTWKKEIKRSDAPAH